MNFSSWTHKRELLVVEWNILCQPFHYLCSIKTTIVIYIIIIFRTLIHKWSASILSLLSILNTYGQSKFCDWTDYWENRKQWIWKAGRGLGTVAVKLPVGEIFLHLSGKSGVLRREKSEEEGLSTKEQSKKTRTGTFWDRRLEGLINDCDAWLLCTANFKRLKRRVQAWKW